MFLKKNSRLKKCSTLVRDGLVCTLFVGFMTNTDAQLLGGLLGGDEDGASDLARSLLEPVKPLVDPLLDLLFIPRKPVDSVRRPYEAPFCYNDPKCGPEKWPGLCQNGIRQSPIPLTMDMVTETVKYKAASSPLIYNEAYNIDHKIFYIGNNGHAVVAKLTPDGSSNAQLLLDDVHSKYKFSQIHFHWGKEDDAGAEHTIDGKSFPMEIHLVHYRDVYKNLEDALANGGDLAVAVVGIMVEIGSEQNVDMEPMIEEINRHALKDTKGMIRVNRKLNLFKFLPASEAFFRYKGSLTVPGCVEKVLWTMYKEPITISKSQMDIFRKVDVGYGHDQHNFRPLQGHNDREVTYFSYDAREKMNFK